jgi:hypothetical protein
MQYLNNSLLLLLLLRATIAFARRVRWHLLWRLQCEFDWIRGLPLQLQRAQRVVQNL